MKTRLTREESQHLIDLGVPKEKASDIECDQWEECCIPIFELEDFLNGEILPKEVEDKTWGFIYRLGIKWSNEVDWLVRYNGAIYFRSVELIDSLYQLACWYYGEYLKSEEK